MDKKSIAKNAYAPYIKESLYCVEIFALVAGLILIIFAAFSVATGINVYIVPVIILSVYAVLDCILNHWLSILSAFERKCDWLECKLTIKAIKTEASWSGHMWESAIKKLYPKAWRVDRYKLICEDVDGKKIVLRSVMRGKKYQIIQDRVFNSLPTECSIMYGRYTKIVMYYKGKDIWTDKLNHMF